MNTNIHARPAGLRNLGNTCFMNASLQCLAQIPELTTLTLEPNQEPKYQLIHSYLLTVSHIILNDGNDGIYKPKEFTHEMKNVLVLNKNGAQEDAAEFLRRLQEKFNILQNDPFLNTLTSTLISTLICPDCHNASKKDEPFTPICLDIPKNAHKLSDCFTEFTKLEVFEKGDEWRCNQCHKKVQAIKTLTIDTTKLPPVMVIQLKRFAYDKKTKQMNKISTPITFPLTIDASTFIESTNVTDQTHVYDLFGIIVQNGSLSGGHYWAYVKDVIDSKWYKCDDSSVSEADIKPIADSGLDGSATPYILFYRKADAWENARKIAQELIKSSQDALAHQPQDSNTTTSVRLLKDAFENLGKKIREFATRLEIATTGEQLADLL